MENLEEIQRETAAKTLDDVLLIIDKKMELSLKLRNSSESMNILKLSEGKRFIRLYESRQRVGAQFHTLSNLYEEICKMRFGI